MSKSGNVADMNMKTLLSGFVLSACLAAAVAGAAYGRTHATSIVPTVKINTPTGTLLTLKTSELSVLPQQTLSVPIGGAATTESGPSLLALLTFAGVQFNSACKNDELRWWVEASNPKGQAVVITAGELDPLFGNRPAILSIDQNGQFLTQNGPTLVVPNDYGGRNLKNVSIITVGRAPVELGDTATPACGTTSLLSTPPSGTVIVNGDVKTPLTLTMAQLAAMPQQSQTDNFLQGTTPNTNTETGPTLYSIVMQAQPKFLACSPNDKARFYVEITSSEDGFAAITAWDEIDPSADNVQDLMSLVNNGVPVLQTDTDPRSTAPGDVRGGRYTFGAAVITVFRAPTEVRIPGCAK
jgi:hypothetical protein